MINVKHINGDNMFNGFRVLNSNYIYLFLNNNYEFASDINTKQKKKRKLLMNVKTSYFHTIYPLMINYILCLMVL